MAMARTRINSETRWKFISEALVRLWGSTQYSVGTRTLRTEIIRVGGPGLSVETLQLAGRGQRGRGADPELDAGDYTVVVRYRGGVWHMEPKCGWQTYWSENSI